mmetsp:Transcript_106180/g.193186  ORF Transcript_106180/g.193186 Transcript_106180/m.193186 type:complete len:661 (+) Transcript_106180:78-2060(+)
MPIYIFQGHMMNPALIIWLLASPHNAVNAFRDGKMVESLLELDKYDVEVNTGQLHRVTSLTGGSALDSNRSQLPPECITIEHSREDFVEKCKSPLPVDGHIGAECKLKSAITGTCQAPRIIANAMKLNLQIPIDLVGLRVIGLVHGNFDCEAANQDLGVESNDCKAEGFKKAKVAAAMGLRITLPGGVFSGDVLYRGIIEMWSNRVTQFMSMWQLVALALVHDFLTSSDDFLKKFPGQPDLAMKARDDFVQSAASALSRDESLKRDMGVNSFSTHVKFTGRWEQRAIFRADLLGTASEFFGVSPTEYQAGASATTDVTGEFNQLFAALATIQFRAEMFQVSESSRRLILMPDSERVVDDPNDPLADPVVAFKLDIQDKAPAQSQTARYRNRDALRREVDVQATCKMNAKGENTGVLSVQINVPTDRDAVSMDMVMKYLDTFLLDCSEFCPPGGNIGGDLFNYMLDKGGDASDWVGAKLFQLDPASAQAMVDAYNSGVKLVNDGVTAVYDAGNAVYDAGATVAGGLWGLVRGNVLGSTPNQSVAAPTKDAAPAKSSQPRSPKPLPSCNLGPVDLVTKMMEGLLLFTNGTDVLMIKADIEPDPQQKKGVKAKVKATMDKLQGFWYNTAGTGMFPAVRFATGNMISPIVQMSEQVDIVAQHLR